MMAEQPNRKYERGLLITAATVSCILTFWLAILDKASSATVTAGLTVAFSVFYFLPIIESFEGFGLKAKLRAQITEAEALLEQLRSTAFLSSKMSFLYLAWMNRMATPTWAAKSKWINELEAGLKAIEVDQAKIDAVRDPIMRVVGFDLGSPLIRILGARVRFRQQELAAVIQQEFPNGAVSDDPRLAELLQRLRGLRVPTSDFVPQMLSDDTFDFSAHLERLIRESGLPDDDVVQLQPIISEMKRVYFECVLAKQLTPEAIKLLDDHLEDHTKWKELYPTAFGPMDP
jgi:hypothetical protein